MQDWSDDADAARRLVLHAISAGTGRSSPVRHNLPDLGEVGAAVARTARLAAASHRARLPRLALGSTQAAGLLEPDAAERAALFADPEGDFPADPGHDLASAFVARNGPDEGRILPATAGHGYVWRLHPAPAEAGAPLASSGGAVR